MTPETIEAFIYGCLAGLFIGVIIGAAFMHAQYTQSVDQYIDKVLREMRDGWRTRL